MSRDFIPVMDSPSGRLTSQYTAGQLANTMIQGLRRTSKGCRQERIARRHHPSWLRDSREQARHDSDRRLLGPNPQGM